MITIDGRYYTSLGMTLPETALALQALGCKDALNLGMYSTIYMSIYIQSSIALYAIHSMLFCLFLLFWLSFSLSLCVCVGLSVGVVTNINTLFPL